MVSAYRILDFAFALSLSLGVGVMVVLFPLVDDTVLWDLLVVIGFVVSTLAAYVLRTRRRDLSSATVWNYSAITFVVFVLLDYGLGVNATSGEGSPVLALVIWLVAVGISVTVYRYRNESRSNSEGTP